MGWFDMLFPAEAIEKARLQEQVQEQIERQNGLITRLFTYEPRKRFLATIQRSSRQPQRPCCTIANTPRDISCCFELTLATMKVTHWTAKKALAIGCRVS